MEENLKVTIHEQEKEIESQKNMELVYNLQCNMNYQIIIIELILNQK